MESGIGYIASVLVIVLFSMTFHEAMHAYAGHWLGDDTAKVEGRLTLNPLAHIDPFLTLALPIMLAVMGLPIFGGAKPVPFNPGRVRYGDFGAALVGIAGPLTNLLIAFIAFGIIAIFNVTNDSFGSVLVTTVLVNLGFFIFNMLPIPPLDGSRVLYALAPSFARRAMEVVEQYGVFFVFAIVLLFSSQLGQLIVGIRNIILSAFGAIFGITMV